MAGDLTSEALAATRTKRRVDGADGRCGVGEYLDIHGVTDLDLRETLEAGASQEGLVAALRNRIGFPYAQQTLSKHLRGACRCH